MSHKFQIPEDGLHRLNFPDGKPSQEYTIKNGKEHGISRQWHENGVLAEESRYKNGLLHGVTRIWNPDGVLLGTSKFRDGTGISRHWFDTGELKSEVSFYHGRITGRMRNWDPDGMLYGTHYFFEDRPISKKGYRAKCKSNPRLPRFKDEKTTNTLGNYVRRLRRAKREQAKKGLTPEQLEQEKWFELRCKNATKEKDSRELLAWLGKKAGQVRELGEMSRREGLAFARKLLALGALKAWVTGIERDHDGAEYSKNLIVLIPPNPVKRGKIYEYCAHPARPSSGGAGPAVKVGTSYMSVSLM